jgi:5-amino-6-(5-phosphoribosylamino)uracil reductase/2,5-diamino-6-(ribosylamino)-4(3H)-pyrimidinone 5'-phosphate reductase
LLELRSHADAILVGRGTLEADRMTLTVPGKEVQPLRCVISRHGVLDPAHPVFTKPGGGIHLLVTGKFTGRKIPGVTVHQASLGKFCETLKTELGVERLHCEGGGQTVRALAELDAIDEFHLTLAGHTLFGGRNSATATGVPGDFLPKSGRFQLSHFEPGLEDGECFLSYTRCG